MINLLPFNDKDRKKAIKVINNSMAAVFTATFKLAVFKSLYIWLCFKILGVNFAYLTAVIAFGLGVLPVFPSWTLTIVAALSLFFRVI